MQLLTLQLCIFQKDDYYHLQESQLLINLQKRIDSPTFKLDRYSIQQNNNDLLIQIVNILINMSFLSKHKPIQMNHRLSFWFLMDYTSTILFLIYELHFHLFMYLNLLKNYLFHQ